MQSLEVDLLGQGGRGRAWIGGGGERGTGMREEGRGNFWFRSACSRTSQPRVVGRCRWGEGGDEDP